jgi:lipopolysaccharide heptosyltransferase II
MGSFQNWSGVKNLLCLRLDSLGDVLMTTPAIHALRQGLPEAKITLLTSPGGQEAVKSNRDLDEILVYQAPWVKWPNLKENSQREIEMVWEIKRRGFDAAIIFTTFSQSSLPAAMFCYLAGVPKRLGYCHENPYLLLTDWVYDKEPKNFILHETQRQLNLVSSVGFETKEVSLVFDIPKESRLSASQKLNQLKLDQKKVICLIHPGCSEPVRTYPWEKYVQVADGLIKNLGWQVVFVSGEKETGLVRKIQTRMKKRSYSLAGRLSLGELAYVMGRADIYLGNNTGPTHLAAAVKTPTVVLYGMTNPQHTPWGVSGRTLIYDIPSCKWCQRGNCFLNHPAVPQAVTPEEVIRAAEELNYWVKTTKTL